MRARQRCRVAPARKERRCVTMVARERWSPAGPGSSARTSAGACSTTDAKCSASTTSTPALAEHRAATGEPAVRGAAPRRDLPALRRGRRDLQPGLSGVAAALSVRPRADHQDERARRHQHAGPGQAAQGEDPPGLHERGLRRSDREPPDRGLLGQRQSDRAAQLLRRGQALRGDPVLRLLPAARLRIKVVRIFNTYGPGMHPNDGRVVSTFIVQALRNQDITVFGDGSQTRSFCYVDDLIEGLVRMMASEDDFVGPVNMGSPRVLDARAGRDGGRLTEAAHGSSISRCRRTTPSSAVRT